MKNVNETTKKTCLNGFWDFLPVNERHPAKDVVPTEGYVTDTYLVPSFWTKSPDAVRPKDSRYYASCKGEPQEYDFTEDDRFLFDTFGYPLSWNKAYSAWIKRTLTLSAKEEGKRYFLVFDAVGPQATLFVNGKNAGETVHPTLPFESDVTNFLVAGENEIAILVEDYDRSEDGRVCAPAGNWIPRYNNGIWQDVFLVERNAVYIDDVTIVTSCRKDEIAVSYEIINTTDADVTLIIAPEALHFEKGAAPETLASAYTLPEARVVVPAGKKASAMITALWKERELWQPEQPKLYTLRTLLLDSEETREAHYERFGFREVWLEGQHFMLNGYPIHMFSDWGHKMTLYHNTEGWIRKWFGMIRDANMNHSRLHTHPHAPLTLDIADEEGILITGETGIHGSGFAMNTDEEIFWERAFEHVRRFVKRDKNHPSVILWSVENEMRWNRDKTDLYKKKLPELCAYFKEIDSTRSAYHEGDSSLWDETAQDLISRHYGKECAGLGWWDKSVPLHSGEMSLFHYEGPNTALHMKGDAAFADFKHVTEASAEDSLHIIEAGRTQGVCAFGPWNLSCLQNVRPESEDVTLSYDDYTTPGVKPLRVPAHSSEFSFWKEGKGYEPFFSFPIMARAFRPFALIDLSHNTQYFAGSTMRRTLTVVNDTPCAVEGTLSVTLSLGGEEVFSFATEVGVGRGFTQSAEIDIVLADDLPEGSYVYRASYEEKEGNVLDAWERTVAIFQAPANEAPLTLSSSVAVFGGGHLLPALSSMGVTATHVNDLTTEALAAHGILIIEKNAVVPGSTQNSVVKAFAEQGGRVIVLEQVTSLFPSLTLEDKPVLTSFIRAYQHRVLDGIAEDLLSYWGEDPYAAATAGTACAYSMYRKDDGCAMLPILDSGEGGFGSGDLEYTPLLEVRVGKGVVYASQMRITEKIGTIPCARLLFKNLLQSADTFTAEGAAPVVYEGALTESDVASVVETVSSGANVIVNAPTDETIVALGKALDVALVAKKVDEVYQAIRVADDGALAGVSNDDTCAIETYSYTQASSTKGNFIVSDLCLEHTEGLEPLLATATHSCLVPLLVQGGKVEPLRAHTYSCFYPKEGETPEQYVIAGRVRKGKGALYINMFQPPFEERAYFSRLRNRLFANLGGTFDVCALDGDAVPHSGANSQGYPERVYVHAGACDEALKENMRTATFAMLERMLSMPILNLGGFVETASPDGVVTISAVPEGEEVRIYFPIFSPKVRKNVEMDLGVPNPEAFTFLDMKGEGIVTPVINGEVLADVALAGDTTVTLPDISLEQGFNHVLLHFRPAKTPAPLSLLFRNIMHMPERSFKFD